MNTLKLFINISVLLFFFISKYNPHNDQNNKSINSNDKLNSSSNYIYGRILKQLENDTLEKEAVTTLELMLDEIEEETFKEQTNEEECKGFFAKLKKKKKKKTKPLKPHNYYARNNKKKEERRQYLKNNKDKLNCLQRAEEKLFTHADLLRSSIFSRTSRKPDGIFYT
ncbi:Plasmodium exported protein, unknown function [Plasmodium sp. gorilla clade G2]|uniref:Plasmodium exported protein, unknown function n=1 Tax=Plasmodium sp. gorilla clade G2 TaxID=880535 RepID=UPI000D2A68E9|nr:Plasmodium exported protein, unknown function [Plasmodium sp. gorilla clade G2]SOV20387.1 Plasmodium exported protein, unknown function [Plasmodium sp. gorilla clade G2]